VTLQGGGQVILSDNAANMISGSVASVTLTNVDNTIMGAGQLGAGALNLINNGTIIADGTNALTIDTGANTVTNTGTLEATGTGGLIVNSALVNSGLLWAHGGVMTFASAVSGYGSAVISGSGSVDFGAASSANVLFDTSAAGLLTLRAPSQYTGSISGFSAADHIDVDSFSFASVSGYSFVENSDHTGGDLTIVTGAEALHLHFTGDLDPTEFVLSADTDGSTLIGLHHHDGLLI